MKMYSSLDLAKQTGVCWGEPNTIPSFETWTLGGVDVPRGKRGRVLMEKLAAHLDYVKPDMVFIEMPMPGHIAVGRGSNQDTTIVLNGYVFLAETVCFIRKVPYRLIERQEALKHFTGKARFPKGIRDAAKKACLARATQLGWVCANYDQSDAGAQWDYGCATENPNAYTKAAASQPVRANTRKTLL